MNTNTPKSKIAQPSKPSDTVSKSMNMDELLVTLMSNLVRSVVDLMHVEGESILAEEARFYRVLAVNCEEKAKLAAAFAGTGIDQQSSTVEEGTDP
jgi:hypothetical protein